MQSNETFKVACIQFNPMLNERDKNIEALLQVVTEAAENGAKLIVTPEMATTGYYYKDRKAVAPFVDCIPGITTARFEQLTRKYRFYIVVGMAEVDPTTDLYYNSAALIGPDGYIGKYRKVHLWESEAHWSALGNLGVPVFETELGKIAINICMDSIYFESARLAAIQGANILAFPTNSSAQSISLLQARAEMNGMYVMSANRSNCENGFQMIGASAIWSPEGEKLAEAPHIASFEQSIDGRTIIYGTVNKKLYNNRAKERLKTRKPECYKELMQYIAPWDFTKNINERTITAAIIQYKTGCMSKEQNFSKHKQFISEAVKIAKEKGSQLDLIVLPELATTGPLQKLTLEKISQLSDSINSPFIKQYQDLAKNYQTIIVIGYVEKEEGNLYNSAILINEYGEIFGNYRKIHLSEDEKRWATAGSQIEVFESTKLGKVGMMIGADAAFPELAGVLSIKRADSIIIPSNWSGEFGRELEINNEISKNKYPDGTNCTWDAIAISSQAYVLVANTVVEDSSQTGRSGLYTLDPLYGLDQPVVASQHLEEILFVNYKTLQHDWWFNQEKLLTLRQTKEYELLVI